MRLSGMQFESFVRLMIRQKSDRTFAGEESIANANARVIHEFRADMHFADLEIHGLKFFDFDFSRQIVERDGKERCCHLPFKNLTQTAARTVITKNLDLVFVVVGRHEKRESLNVVPMNVGDEQAEINWARSEFILEGETERSNSRSGVQNNKFAISAHF